MRNSNDFSSTPGAAMPPTGKNAGYSADIARDADQPGPEVALCASDRAA